MKKGDIVLLSFTFTDLSGSHQFKIHLQPKSIRNASKIHNLY